MRVEHDQAPSAICTKMSSPPAVWGTIFSMRLFTTLSLRGP